MRLKLLCLIVILTTAIEGFSQREAAVWYFGNQAGLDFNSGIPQPLNDSRLDTFEGCESFSDENGNMIFYTEGKTVFNGNHDIMVNGEDLLGSFSATQSALVVPAPNNEHLYYMFTSDAVQNHRTGNPFGINYSVIDMRLDGGLGAVTEKNVNLIPASSEKLTAVLAANGVDYWVVSHYRDAFYAFRVTPSGVNTSPVISTVGPLIDNFNNTRGAIKVAPDASRIAVAHAIFEPELSGNLLLYDFDSETGVVSNELQLADDLLFYGAEFSPEGSKFYASGRRIIEFNGQLRTTNVDVIQFDMEATDIASSRFEIVSIPNSISSDLAGALQLGIDKKIYHAIIGNQISVIRTPSLLGNNSDYRLYDIDLAGGQATYGLPPYVQSFFENIVDIERFCFMDETEFSIRDTSEIDSVTWDFGDPASGADNVSTALNPTHVFSSAGIFEVVLQVNYIDRPTRQFIEFVEISELPTNLMDTMLTQCDSDTDGQAAFNLDTAYNLEEQPANLQVLFFNSEADAVANENVLEPVGYVNSVNDEIVYARIFENSQCFIIREVTLHVDVLSYVPERTIDVCNIQPGLLGLTIDTTQIRADLAAEFPGSTITLYMNEEDALLQENEIVAEARYGLDEYVMYFRVEDMDGQCEAIGRMNLNVLERPFVEDMRFTLCGVESMLELEVPEAFLNYSWSTGDTTRAITVSEPGDYDITVSNGNGCEFTATYTVVGSDDVVIRDIEVTDFSTSNRIVIDVELAERGDVLYSIDGGITFQESPIFENVPVDIYDVLVTRDDCAAARTTVAVLGMPLFFTPNGDGFNDRYFYRYNILFEDSILEIYDRYGKRLAQFNHRSGGWDGTYQGQPMPSSDYWYKITLQSGRVVKGHFTLKR